MQTAQLDRLAVQRAYNLVAWYNLRIAYKRATVLILLSRAYRYRLGCLVQSEGCIDYTYRATSTRFACAGIEVQSNVQHPPSIIGLSDALRVPPIFTVVTRT